MVDLSLDFSYLYLLYLLYFLPSLFFSHPVFCIFVCRIPHSYFSLIASHIQRPTGVAAQ